MHNTCKRVFNTPDGILLLAFLKESVVDKTCLRPDSHHTTYALGQKELVQTLLDYTTLPEKVDEAIEKLNFEDGD